MLYFLRLLKAVFIGVVINFFIFVSFTVYTKCLVQNETILCVRKAEKTFSRKYNTVASRRLDNENLVYPVSQKHYDFIDGLIDDCVKKAKANPNLCATKTMNILYGETQKQVQGGAGQDILARAIDEKNFDCGTFSTVFVSFAQILDLPLEVVSIPGHIFVRWVLTTSAPINFELNCPLGLLKRKGKNITPLGQKLPIDSSIVKKENFLKKIHGNFAAAYWEKNIQQKNWFQKLLVAGKAFSIRYE